MDYTDKEEIRGLVKESIKNTYSKLNESPQESAAWYLQYALSNFGDPSNMSTGDLAKVYRAADELGLFYQDTRMVSQSVDLSQYLRSEQEAQQLAQFIDGAVREISNRDEYVDYAFQVATDYSAEEISSIISKIDRVPSVWSKIMNFVSAWF